MINNQTPPPKDKANNSKLDALRIKIQSIFGLGKTEAATSKTKIQNIFDAKRQGSAFNCYLIVLPAIIMVFVFTFIPIAWALLGSFYKFDIGTERTFVGFKNYIDYLVHDPVTWPSMLVMTIFLAAGVILQLTVPLIVAKLIYSVKSEKLRYLYRLFFLVPIVVPSAALYLLWKGMIYNEHGMINQILSAIGLSGLTAQWLSDPSTVILAIIFIGFPFAGGVNVLLYYAGLTNIPESVNDSALLEGCVGVRKFLIIDIPLVLSQLKLIFILSLIGGVQSYVNIMILTEGGPGFTSMVPGYWMYLNAFSYQKMGYACAIGVVLFVIILALTLISRKYFKTSESIKGEDAV